MSFRIKPGTESFLRVILSIIVLFNAVVPTAALALPSITEESGSQPQAGAENSLPASADVYYNPSTVIPIPNRFSVNADEAAPKTPEKDQIEFSISTSNGAIKADRSITINVLVRNHSEDEITNLTYYDKLEDDFSYDSSSDSVSFNFFTNTVKSQVGTLGAGEQASFSYVLNAENIKTNKLSIHSAEVEYELSNGETRAQTSSMGVADHSSLVDSDSLIIVPDKIGDGWETTGRYSLYLNDEVLEEQAVVLITPAEISENGPALQFNLDLIKTTVPEINSSGDLAEQDINLTGNVDSAFESPAYLEINLDGVADLADMPADQEPYVVTYDEESHIWVKVPIIATDPSSNSVTVEAAHFSTWGAGLGNSLPKNGANVLLFDQPYTSLFTGASRYSIPIWTPPGRAGLAPDVALSYSSATVDGVLGDVQAPWVGVGWNIDGIEIVRKITTNENGYGYSNNFALTLNGTVYELLVDPNNPNRYYTKQGSFLYVERHNFALANALAVTNKTGEWWEVVSTDGTRYRLGWNNDSEQLALMYGYSCKTGNPCTTPAGAYATLGYAGKADDLVALRWRVDRITDTHGNSMTYEYTETQPSGATTLAKFDRESYLTTISYTGFEDPQGGTGNLAPGYQVEFVTAPRSTIGDVPTTFNIWDNLDSKYLDKILIRCLLCATPNQILRTYDLNYSLATVPNANGTLTLTEMKISGEEFAESGQMIQGVNAPAIKFTYQNLDNRNVTGTSNDRYTYPRLQVINNGTGGLLTYSYETDGRGIASWYDYRVKDVRVESGLGTSALQSYTYTTPVYTNVGGTNLGDLIGYTTTLEKQLDYNNANAVILETKHDFGTQGLDTGYELKTDWLSGTNVLKRTANTYVTDNTKAPFSGWNYRYLYQRVNYINNGGSLLAASKVLYTRDPATGNLLVQTDYLGTSTYRKTYYEYLTNTNASVYILDKASRVLVVNASNAVLSDTRYHYDGKRNTAPDQGNLTLTQSLTGGGTTTVNSGAHYDVYGNVDKQIQYTTYGSTASDPAGATQESSFVYDGTFQTYPISQTNPLGESASTAYVFGLGVPYQSTDANGWVTTTTYDSLGRQLSIRVPGVDDEAVWYKYPVPNGSGAITAPYSVEMQILDTTANLYRSVWGIYDGLGRQIQMQVFNADTNNILVTDTEFNPQGSVYRQSSPYSVNTSGGYYVNPSGTQFTSSLYDALGRVTQMTQPGNLTTLTSYGGLVTTVINPQGQTSERGTDGLGRLTTVREYVDSNTVYATTRYNNDELNRLVSMTDAQSNTTTLTYDWLGRKTGMDDPDMGIWTYEYNATGTLYQQTDARTETLTFGYDALNRLISKTGTDLDSSYTYGNTPGNYGFRIGMTDASGASTWSYDNYGRTATEVRALTGAGSPQSMTTTSDWLGRPLSVTYPDNEVLTYTYDALGRPDKLDSDASSGSLVDLTYNVLGQITTQALGNGLTITNTYDPNNNRLTSRASTGGLLNFGYTYDSAGNITTLTDSVLNETHQYTYDFLNRLKTAKAYTAGNTSDVKYDQKFEYDKVGNITQMNDWVTATPMGALDSGSSHVLAAPVSYRSPQQVNSANFFPAMPVRQEDTETPTATQTPTETLVPSDTPTVTLTPSVTNTYTPTATKTKVPTNTAITATYTPTVTNTPWSGADGYSSSMLHFNGVDASTSIIDETGKVWTTGGNAQIDTAQSKFGGASGLFDGNGDYFSSPDHNDFFTNTSDFTIDYWVRFATLPTTSGIQFTAAQSGGGYGWETYIYNNAGTYYLYFNVDKASATYFTIGQPITLATATWYHLAIVRSGNSWYSYKDGVQLGTTMTQSKEIPDISAVVQIGNRNGGATGLNGWIDEFRFSRGVARWTANFTPPTSAYGYGPEPSATPTYTSTQTLTPTKTNTSTITFTPSSTPTPYTITPTASKTLTPTNTLTPTPHLGSLLAYWSFEGVTGTTVNDDALGDVTNNSATLSNGPVIQSSGAQGSSVFFDGTNDYASIADQAEINKNGSFTISAWVNPASLVTGRTQYILQKGGASKDYGFITVSTQGTATPTANPGNSNANGSIAFQIGDLTPNTLFGPILPVNTWTMVTGVYDSTAGQMRLYLNGELVASQAVTGTLSMSTTGLTFSSSVAANVYHGSLDEVRFYNRALIDSEVQSIFGSFVTPTPLPVSSTPTVVTATPNITAIPLGQQPWGTGNDGSLTIASGDTFNINTQTSGNNGRTCADAVAYNVTQLGDTAATLDSTPTSSCLNAGDEIILIQMAGDNSTGYNAGSYEYLRIVSISGATVNFSTSKVKWYGTSWRSDSNIGIGSGQLRVMLMRVPNYNNVTINGTLTTTRILAFRILGTLSGAGNITASGLGFGSGTGYGAGGPGAWRSSAGGGGYSTTGTAGAMGFPCCTVPGAAGTTYGDPTLGKIFQGSGGGTGGEDDSIPGHEAGGKGGGIVMISGQDINFSGTITANGANGAASYGAYIASGSGSGGSIRIEGNTISLANVTANGGTTYATGGSGRIAVYYQNTLSGLSSQPSAYTSLFAIAATPSPTATSINFATQVPWGEGSDGNLTVNNGSNFNQNTQGSNSRTCADAISYTVSVLDESYAILSSVPVSTCLSAGDEILIMHIAGSGFNVGNYEFLKVGGVVNNIVYFINPKTKYYGSLSESDAGVGGAQSVILQRVPNYNNVTINGTLTTTRILAFRILGTLSGAGNITASGLGFGSGTGYGAGGPGAWRSSAGGGGYSTTGTAGAMGFPCCTVPGAAGTTYGDPTLGKIFQGSGGGTGGEDDSIPGHEAGGKGGGIVMISGQDINFSGTITANGANGAASYGAYIASGSGSGGSIRIEGNTISLANVTANGGTTYATGGLGRIAVYYYTSFTGSFTPGYSVQVNPNATTTPTATPTAIPGFDANVVSLLHMDGTDASTSFVDQTGKTWTANGNAQIDTAQSKFGGASGLFDGTDSISFADSPDWDLGTGNFTIDFWVRLNALPATNAAENLVWRNRTAGGQMTRLTLVNSAGTYILRLTLDGTNRDQTWSSPTTNTWYHIAVVRSGTNLYHFINGVQIGSTITSSDNIVDATALNIGGNGTSTEGLNGWMDEVRISKGIARWTSNFTPPTSAYYGNYVQTTPTAAPTSWVEKTYAYSTAIPHAVTTVTDKNAVNLGTYEYDANGNMTCRVEDDVTYKQEYNAENRIASIAKLVDGTCAEPGNYALKWDFAYDGDGTRMSTLVTPYDETTGLPQAASFTSYYFGGAYETRSDGGIFKYYSLGGQSIVNEYKPATSDWHLSYMLTDNLGSVVAVTDDDGDLVTQQRYLPFGGERTDIGTISQTDLGYTGQRDNSYIKLMDYHFRWYSPYLNHFTQPDTIVPDPYNPQDWNRYAYARNNPLKYTDPSGHVACSNENSYAYQNCIANKNPIDILKDNDSTNDYIKTLARKYNIELSPNEDWKYFEYELGRSDISYDLGFHVWDAQGGFTDGQETYDDSVYMTNLAFIELGTPIQFASVMAHEAQHSKQEYFSDIGILELPPRPSGGSANPDSPFKVVNEADAYAVQALWLKEHGQAQTSFYQQMLGRADANRFLVDQYGLGATYSFPLFIYYSGYPK